MRFTEFSQKELVQGFVDCFSRNLDYLHVSYRSKFKKIKPEFRDFDATGVEAALDQYIWPSNIKYCGSRSIETWKETQTALQELSEALVAAIKSRDKIKTEKLCEAILLWGMGKNRFRRSLTHLTQQPDLCGHLQSIRDAVEQENLGCINASLVQKMGSGLSKVYSLANPGNLVILDSRVSQAIGVYILQYIDKKTTKIPEELSIGSCERQRRARFSECKMPMLRRDHHWLVAQLKLTWLLKLTLHSRPDVFRDKPFRERLHSLEAALFMLGASNDSAQWKKNYMKVAH